MENVAIALGIISIGLMCISFIFMRSKDYVCDKSEYFKAERSGKDLDKILTKTGYRVYIFGVSLFVLDCISIAVWAISRSL